MKPENYYVFDITLTGDFALADHFMAHEFKCADNSRVVILDPDLISLLEKIRTHFKKPVHVNSGYRTVSWNSKQKNSSPHSQHILGKAADIWLNDVTPLQIYNYVNSLYPNSCGLGIYSTFCHVDVRTTKSRWDYRTK